MITFIDLMIKIKHHQSEKLLLRIHQDIPSAADALEISGKKFAVRSSANSWGNAGGWRMASYGIMAIFMVTHFSMCQFLPSGNL